MKIDNSRQKILRAAIYIRSSYHVIKLVFTELSVPRVIIGEIFN